MALTARGKSAGQRRSCNHQGRDTWWLTSLTRSACSGDRLDAMVALPKSVAEYCFMSTLHAMNPRCLWHSQRNASLVLESAICVTANTSPASPVIALALTAVMQIPYESMLWSSIGEAHEYSPASALQSAVIVTQNCTSARLSFSEWALVPMSIMQRHQQPQTAHLAESVLVPGGIERMRAEFSKYGHDHCLAAPGHFIAAKR